MAYISAATKFLTNSMNKNFLFIKNNNNNNNNNDDDNNNNNNNNNLVCAERKTQIPLFAKS